MASELLKRSEVKEADTWNVKDMYPTTEAWENELKVITEIVDKIASYEGSVAATAENLLAVLEHLASAGEKIEKAFNYAERLFDEDQTNTTHQAMSAKVYSLYAAMGSKTAFVDPEILAASEETLEGFLKEKPELELYRKQLAEIAALSTSAEISFNSFSHAPVFSYISLVFHVSSSLTSLRFNNSDAIMIFLFPVFTINCVLQDPMKYTLLSILA